VIEAQALLKKPENCVGQTAATSFLPCDAGILPLAVVHSATASALSFARAFPGRPWAGAFYSRRAGE
jgi:hypothetical protein